MNKIGGLVRLSNKDEVQTYTPGLFYYFFMLNGGQHVTHLFIFLKNTNNVSSTSD